MEQIFEYAMIDLFFFASALVVVQYKRGKIDSKKEVLFFCLSVGIGFLFGAAGKLTVNQDVGNASVYFIVAIWSFVEFIVILLSKKRAER